MVLEVLLRNSIEGERGHRTLQARSCHTPCAVGAAPTAEVVAVNPDQVFVHTFAFARVLGLELGLRWVGHQASESHLTTMGNFPWNPRVAKYQRCLATTLTEGTFGGQVPGLTRPEHGVCVVF